MTVQDAGVRAGGVSNGVRINVPPFIGAGTRIVVMTADGSYVERAKE